MHVSDTIGDSDVTLATTRSRFPASDFLQSKDIEFSLNVDNIAQESNETFVLTLQLTSIDQFGVDATIRDRLEVVIIDSDGKLAVQSPHFMFRFSSHNSNYLPTL